MILSRLLESSAERAGMIRLDGPLPARKDTRSLAKAVKSPAGKNAVIAEIKPASPSRGVIRDISDPAATARELETGGCSAISVITEPTCFMGSTASLSAVRDAVSVPVLRKDFIVDPGQVCESSLIGADAVLLIAAVLGERLDGFVDLARSCGLESLVEVHTLHEAGAALDSRADLIGINNRDLATQRIDLQTTRRLSPVIREAGGTVISESGIVWPCDIAGLRPYADGFLIGSAIMAAREPRRRLEGFVCA